MNDKHSSQIQACIDTTKSTSMISFTSWTKFSHSVLFRKEKFQAGLMIKKKWVFDQLRSPLVAIQSSSWTNTVHLYIYVINKDTVKTQISALNFIEVGRRIKAFS